LTKWVISVRSGEMRLTTFIAGFGMVAMGSWAITGVSAQGAELVGVQKIWDKAEHNAFTDLIRYKNLWFCCFREGKGHVGGDGTVRILISSTGDNWVDYAEIKEPGVDLRDPKFEVMPDGKQLYVVMGGSIYEGNTLVGRRPRYSTSQDGKVWTPPQKLLSEGDWLWRVTAHPSQGKLFGVSYNMAPVNGGVKAEAEWSAKMYSSVDGSVWQLESILNVPGQPNEATVRFLKDGRAMVLVRRESEDRMGMVGVSEAPHRQWSWTKLNAPLGGPNFIELPDGTLIAGSRGFGATPGPHMVLFKLTDKGWSPLLELTSAGDCSYPGLVWHDGTLWVSYYSSHEGGKSAIYLAKVRL
jgi:hypothetical protein